MRQVAAAISNLRPEERKEHHDKAAAYFRRANPNFKADVFRKACGVSDGMERSDYVKESSKITKKTCVDYLMDSQDMTREQAVEECRHRRRNLDEETKDTGYDPRAAQAIANAYIKKRKLKNKKK